MKVMPSSLSRPRKWRLWHVFSLVVMGVWLSALSASAAMQQTMEGAEYAEDMRYAAVPGAQVMGMSEGAVHASHDASDDVLVANPMGCQTGELFVEVQDWWIPTPGVRGKDFGHLHLGFCFPHRATVRGKMSLNIRSIMHHNPGSFRRISIQIFAAKRKDAPDLCADNSAIGCVDFKPPRTCPVTQTCTWRDVVSFNTADIAYDGWQEVRVHGVVSEPDGSEMHTSTGLYVYLQNGRAIRDYVPDPNLAMGRGWYSRVKYTNASVVLPPTVPVSGIWTPEVRLERGSGGLPVTGWYASIDADTHNHNFGFPLCPSIVRGPPDQPQCGVGQFRGALRIDTTRLRNGWHRLFLKSDAKSAPDGSTHSGVLVIYFEVRGS